MRKVIVSGLSPISGAWVGYTCDRIHLRELSLGIPLHERKKCNPQSITRQSGLDAQIYTSTESTPRLPLEILPVRHGLDQGKAPLHRAPGFAV